ncbi:glutaredoxin 2 [Nile crocodilepox virus]|uniref:Glutaredoxin 2 n=1 Tax=Nile crocodilepox virus (isolate Crocodylus niloticus/Zimbabwe/Ume/2001) TaxID=1289473 RepID=Q070H6_CPRVZ|nr:glutaredoxin 2 [Nile crocodilepox virus]ABJ08966.1 glutaredoxin 2 [Nile crocodilepox virus]
MVKLILVGKSYCAMCRFAHALLNQPAITDKYELLCVNSFSLFSKENCLDLIGADRAYGVLTNLNNDPRYKSGVMLFKEEGDGSVKLVDLTKQLTLAATYGTDSVSIPELVAAIDSA